MKNLNKYIDKVKINELQEFANMQALDDSIKKNILSEAWNITTAFNVKNLIYGLKLNGLQWNNYVMIAKQSNNKYRIYLVDLKGEIHDIILDVSESDLIYEIDCLVEQPKNMSDEQYRKLIEEYNKTIEVNNEKSRYLQAL